MSNRKTRVFLWSGALGLSLALGLQAPSAWGQATDLVCSGCVQGSDIANGTIGPNKLIPGSINATTIANGSIGPNKLIPGSINTATIATNAIRSNKILDGAVQGVDLADGAVTAAKLAAGAVGAAALAEDAVFGRILVVRNDPLDQTGNCDELLAVLANITDNDADNRYLIHLEPGIYDCDTTPVQMKSFVDLQGSGITVTEVTGNIGATRSTGVINVADSSELRHLAVENSCTSGECAGISVTGDNARLSNVSASFANLPTAAFGVSVIGGGPSLTKVRSETPATTGFSIAVWVNSGTATLVDVTGISLGILSSSAGLWLNQPTMVRNSVFAGSSLSLQNNPSGSGVVSTQLDGPKGGAGTPNCVGAYDGAFAPLDSACLPPAPAAAQARGTMENALAIGSGSP